MPLPVCPNGCTGSFFGNNKNIVYTDTKSDNGIDTLKTKIKEQAIIEAEKNASMYEAINGIATIKGLATEDKAFFRTEHRIVEAAYKNLELKKVGNLQNTLQTFISSCGTLAIYWVGSYMIFKNYINSNNKKN